MGVIYVFILENKTIMLIKMIVNHHHIIAIETIK